MSSHIKMPLYKADPYSVPHECDDPKCPGNVNRMKLEAFDEMVEMLEQIRICSVFSSVFSDPHGAQRAFDKICELIETALAKAEKLEDTK